MDAAAQGSMWTTLIMFAAIILIFYFLIIRPQKKRDKETKAMLDAMKKGDKVVSIGGIHGTVVTVKDQSVIVKVDDNTRLEFSKSAISSVVNKDAAKANPNKKKDDKKVEDKKAEDAKPVEAKADEPAKTDEPDNTVEFKMPEEKKD